MDTNDHAVSIAFLTVDFLGQRTLSINYHLAVLLGYLESHLNLNKITIYSHKDRAYEDDSLSSVMSKYGIPSYTDKARVVTVNCVTSDDIFSELEQWDLLVSTYHLWGHAIAKIKEKSGHKPKVIYWVPSILLQEYMSDRQRKWYRFEFMVQLQKKMIMHADHTIWISQYDRDLGRRYFGSLIEPANVIYPVSLSVPAGTREASSTGYPCKREDSETRFGYAGRLDYRKGLHLLIEAFFRYFTEKGNVSLYILSDFSLSQQNIDSYLDAQVKREFFSLYELGVIRFFPWTNYRKDYLNFLISVGAVVLPSLYDPFNIIAYDCFQLRVPLVLSRFCGVEEIIDDNAALVRKVNPFDVGEMYDAMAQLSKMGHQKIPAVTYEKARADSLVDRMIEDTFSTYKQVLRQ